MVSVAAKDGGLMPVNEMGKIIAKITAKHGNKVLDDRRKVMGLLRDYAPQEPRGIKLLMASFDQGSPQVFAENGAAPQRLMLDQQVNALVANAGLQNDLAQWATEAWSHGLYDGAAPAPAPSVPAADDLTWGSEVVSAAPVAAAAATMGMAMAPSATASPPPPNAYMPAAPQAARPAMGQKTRWFIIACAAITALATLAGIIDRMTRHTEVYPQQTGGGNVPQTGQGDQPQEQPQQQAPQAAPQQQQAGDPVQADGTPWVLTSNSDDGKQWPTFAGANHPKNDPLTWQFLFNSRVATGHLVFYQVTVALNSNLKDGKALIAGIDLGKDKSLVSISTPIDANRAYQNATKTFETSVSQGSWAKDDAQIPPICVSFTSGASAKRFAPEGGDFCAWEVTNGTCGASLGCGHVNN